MNRIKNIFLFSLLIFPMLFSFPITEALECTHNVSVYSSQSSFYTLVEEEPFEFIAATAVYPNIPQEELFVLDIHENNFLMTFRHEKNFALLKEPIQPEEWEKLPSMADLLVQWMDFHESLPVTPEWISEKLHSQNTIVVTLGDNHSFIGRIAQQLHKNYISLGDIRNVVHSYSGESWGVGEAHQVFVNSLKLLAIMEHFGLETIHYRSTESEFPTNDSFFEWPDSIASLYFFQGGGFTVSPVSNVTPTRGYAVSLVGYSEIVSAEEFFGGPVGHENGRQIMKKYLHDNARLFLLPGIYFGGWHDLERDLVFLDLSEVILDLERAIQVAKERDQIAIYDLASGVTIDTGGSGGVDD